MNFTLIKSYEDTKIAFTHGAPTLHLQFICYVHCNFEKSHERTLYRVSRWNITMYTLKVPYLSIVVSLSLCYTAFI